MAQAESELPPDEVTEMLVEAAPVFAALGHETRLRLAVQLGATGPRSISELTEDSDISRQAITKHLNVLASAGLVHGARQGREHRWEIDPEGVLAAERYLEQISRQWDDTLERLKDFVENDSSTEDQ